MKSTARMVEVTTFASEICPEITTDDPRLAEIIAWADAHPLVYKIVNTGKSKAFGRGSSHYLGWAQRDMSVEAIFERITTFRHALETAPAGFWSWRARFTLEHFDKKLKGGLFQQHALWPDGKEYPRSCTYLDYTTATLEEVLDRFEDWMDPWYPRDFDSPQRTTRLTVDGEDKRIYAAAEGVAAPIEGRA